MEELLVVYDIYSSDIKVQKVRIFRLTDIHNRSPGRGVLELNWRNTDLFRPLYIHITSGVEATSAFVPRSRVAQHQGHLCHLATHQRSELTSSRLLS